ncbi:thiamine phosphate synthase [Eubacterium xylanophilum]|uniref:thiamine phosphate synthase n=1 Tax=Eubacterium xylanophilum TaxID=39497 RepID=UPI00047B791A|nr:thiamine phosphate synthase [Eubacterium xylanophilum]
MNCSKEQILLYAITDRHWLGNRPLTEVVEESLRGGATMIQLREKNLDEAAFLQEAKALRDLCKKYSVPFIINDNISIAAEVDADGVHVGQSDMAASKAREILGKDKIIGVTAKTIEQAIAAEQMGADYLGVGAVFPTSSKEDALPITHEMLRKICETVSIPVAAIGGITKDNIPQLKGNGISGIATISAIYGMPNIEESTRELKKIITQTVL